MWTVKLGSNANLYFTRKISTYAILSQSVYIKTLSLKHKIHAKIIVLVLANIQYTIWKDAAHNQLKACNIRNKYSNAMAKQP